VTARPRAALLVERAGPRTTVQDLGRPHLAHLGVPAAGAADVAALRAANAAVGNRPGAAALESTLGGDILVATTPLTLAVTGARTDLRVDGDAVAPGGVVHLAAGQRLQVGRARDGVYVYVAVAGGVDVPVVLGSRSTDTLSHLGGRLIGAGDVLEVGPVTPQGGRGSAAAPLPSRTAPLRLMPGPHLSLVDEQVWATLLGTRWTVTPASDRVALRLAGPSLEPRLRGIRSEGLVPGAVQLPPDRQPVLFLANHPVTGGYPVIAVVRSADVGRAAQHRPGEHLSFAE
jgi:biotin-dependent carboxylase-like uncharacterized protein